MPLIPAVTVYEPWATLIAIKAKPYEFRGHRGQRKLYGQRIAIHSASRPVRKSEVADLIGRLQGDAESRARTCLIADLALPFLERLHADPKVLPLSLIVATATFGTPIPGPDVLPEFGGVLNDSDRDGHANYAWPMLDVLALKPPVQARGSQGFWKVALTPEQIGTLAAAA